ncbi:MULTISPECIES: hypothetical protein [unclassified Nodularia (in: cyanobacteria)]|uniref:hypothetical protein n=1 Tax=unclassified Nodularia (in: cyanobacteria) TaxID=2656917 RepID=UPI00187E9E1E|nr:MULTISPECIES: hypothetical protein [unclassified Nodularia (in: cyanobacteria)]MBE9199516.1 hypothetical protein [Nodularia sp. LEGE 06071]MCC2691329.1 hypothetical protein [Nodularia sp. LEGE 04288]
MPYTAWEGYIVNFIGCLKTLVDYWQQPVIAGMGTALGIVFGNWVINSFKYKNLLEDVSKVWDLVISNQLDDIYNIRIACQEVQNRLTINAQTIIGSTSADSLNITFSDPKRTDEERRGLLKYVERIKDRASTIKNDNLYKEKLGDIQLFKSSNLSIIVRYCRKLNILLEDIKNFTSYDFPSTNEEFNSLKSHSVQEYKERTSFIIARINSVICLGLIAKKVFKSFNAKDERNLFEIYTELSHLEQEIQDERTIYFLLKEDFDRIKSNVVKGAIALR